MKKKRFGKKGVIITAVSAAAVIVIVIACVVSSTAGKTKTGISYMTLQKTTLEDAINVTGTIHSNNSSSVYTTLTSPVQKVSVDVGDNVKKGDILAVLDASSLEEDIRQQEYATKAADSSASLGMEKARSDYESALDQYNNDTGTELTAAKNSLASAQAALNAEEQTYDAMKAAVAAGKATQNDLTAEHSRLNQAQQTYASAQQGVTSAKNQSQQNLKSAKSEYDSAVAKNNDKSSDVALEKLRKEMQQSVITAPMDGTVTQCNAAVGDIPKSALFRVENTSDLIVEAEVKEIDIDRVKVGDQASITTDATGKNKVSGEVVYIAPAATDVTAGMSDTAKAGTQSSDPTFTVKVHITDKNPSLKVGMKAKMNLILEQKKGVFVVPYDSLVQKTNGSNVVYVAKKDGALYKAEEVPVTVGLETDVSTEIAGSGLQDGMKIITGVDGITNGQIVLLSSSSSSGEE